MTDFTKNLDIKQSIARVHEKYPNAAVYGLGISMGANTMLKLAGEEPESLGLKAMVSVSNPWDLLRCQ